MGIIGYNKWVEVNVLQLLGQFFLLDRFNTIIISLDKLRLILKRLQKTAIALTSTLNAGNKFGAFFIPHKPMSAQSDHNTPDALTIRYPTGGISND